MFNPISVIERKRDGQEISRDEIYAIIGGFHQGAVKDYQMSAFAMAVCCRGMSDREISDMTAAMLDSGRRLQPVSDKPRVDKHSTGGLGDKISLILAPLLACCDLDVPMLSGRGLGITGGTLDKLEAIPGYRTNLSEGEIESQLKKIGCVITGTTSDVVPADRMLYALRDVTGTVPSVALITGSIMSKKMAESLNALSLDVKFGTGAFMKTRTLAEELSRSLQRVGESFGVRTTARINDMNFPTGNMVGNLNEVMESIDVLRGKGPSDVVELTLNLCSDLLVSTGVSTDHAQATQKLQSLLDDGSAYERFVQMVSAQNGSIEKLPALAKTHEHNSHEAGALESVDCYAIGMSVIALGGGRSEVGQALDHRVGLKMITRIGQHVRKGETLCEVYSDNADRLAVAKKWLDVAFKVA